ncbi:hypothetical protein AB0L40_11105 [Patulibacter sp. NPDC049589]|uniref:hypothetical protein n=1 Tax=Patulibacter sp. NPDC049589 TaxID=3154731 RepID=UPI0034251D6F
MSTEPPEDPFAFPEDDADARKAADAPDPGAAEDPFAFPEDDADAREAADAPAPGDTPEAGDDDLPVPAGRRRGRRRRSGTVAPARTDEESARIRRAAEAASQRAQAVGVRWLAVAGIALVVLAGLTTLLGGDRGPTGGDVQPGERLPVFAAPLATQPKLAHDDVNLADADGQGERGDKAACSVTTPSAITSCALLRRGPLVLVLFSRGVAQCVDAVDELERARRRFPSLQTLAVATLGQHDDTAETVRARGWTLPVAYDRDRGLSALLGAPACPLVLFVRQDGTVAQRIIGRLRPEALVRGMEDLARAAAPPATTVDSTPSGR